jgi:drug/metabolite transporter (DMT)-like permease
MVSQTYLASGEESENNGTNIRKSSEFSGEHMKLRDPRMIPFILALVANIIWGFSFIASKVSLEAWGPITVSALRFGIASIIFYTVFLLLKKRIETPQNYQDWLWIFLIGTTGFGLLYPLQMSGLKSIPSSISACMMLTAPLFVVLLGAIVLREALSYRKLIAIFLGILGGLILLNSDDAKEFKFDSAHTIGLILTILSSLSLSLSVILTRQLSSKLDATMITFWSMAIGFFELAIAAFIFEENSLANIFKTSTVNSWISLIFLAAICSAVCFYIWNLALSKGTVREIASTMHIKTPVAIFAGTLLAGEPMTWPVLIGTSVVLLGVVLSQSESRTKNNPLKTFRPDVVIEATSVCNRSCSGCYAPNVVSQKSALELMNQSPQLFLKVQDLKTTLLGIKKKIKTVSIRGGEPTLHPNISGIVSAVSQFSKNIIIETHGRWILGADSFEGSDLYKTIIKFKVILKISFDKMHGLSQNDLQLMTNKMDECGISYLIAITEATPEEFQLTRLTCSWIPDSKVIYQEKSASVDKLVRPSLGVINVSGSLKFTVTAKDSFSLPQVVRT